MLDWGKLFDTAAESTTLSFLKNEMLKFELLVWEIKIFLYSRLTNLDATRSFKNQIFLLLTAETNLLM